MRIGIDIDGVLTDISKFYLDYGAKFAFENNIEPIITDPNEYEIEEILDLEKGAHKEFWEKYDEFYTKKIYTREFAAEVIDKLKSNGNEIHIITARNPKEEQSETWTSDWLDDNNIHYDNLVFTDKKVEYCREKNIDLVIEDNVNNVLALSKIIPVICLDNGYNKECEGKNITRCYSWYDIYSKILKMNKRG